ncbi:MAG: flagellar biosynthesis protein FliQ [Pseudomonadales bacterium]|nr:flagellar biosynthesis protein FliQ [Pseudomonadales bacterium]MCP5215358.1 flagellar biosynthesis protein FliQ [Pseudomonadales bacterium]
MTPEVVTGLFGEALFLAVVMVAVIVVPSLLVGLVISMFQAATQINEQTLSFLPRLLITLLTIMAAGPWLISRLLEFAERIFSDIPALIG